MQHMSQDIMEIIRQQIESNPIILYMKGSPNQPQCGFSARASQVLMACGERFAYVDILANPEIRANLPAYGNWPTFPPTCRPTATGRPSRSCGSTAS